MPKRKKEVAPPETEKIVREDGRGKRLSKPELEMRAAKVLELWTQKKSTYEIADELKITQPAVMRHITTLRREYLLNKSHFMDIMERELEWLEYVRQQAKEEWERSKLPQKTTSASGSQGGTVTVTTYTREQTGDPAYLTVIQNAGAQIAKLLELVQPELTAEVNPRPAPQIIMVVRKPIEDADDRLLSSG